MESWLNYLDHNRGHTTSTIRTYRRYLHRYLIYLEGRDPMTVTLNMLEEFTGIYLYKLRASPNSRNIFMACLRGFYTWAHKTGAITVNPATGLENLKVGRKLPPLMGLDHAQTLLQAPDLNTFIGLRDAAIFHVLLGTGCRVSGLVRLNQSDLIWYRETEGRERLAIRLCEKGKAERVVPCPMEVGLMIRAYLGHEYLDSVDRFIGQEGDQVLFINLNGGRKDCRAFGENRRITVMGLQQMMKKYCKRTNIPKEFWHPHAFRHLYATELREGGADLQEIATLLGHTQIQTTVIYNHLAYRRLSKIVDESNPMNRVKGPVTDLSRRMDSSSP
jgi:site-specific recombinase XerD